VATERYSLFDSAALDQLLQHALNSNPGRKGARHDLQAAQHELATVAGPARPRRG
jgi:hypothetical protein